MVLVWILVVLRVCLYRKFLARILGAIFITVNASN